MIDELKSYVANDNGQTGALPGHNDDLIMALGIAWEVRRTHLDKLTNDRVSWRDRQFVQENNEVWL